MLNKQIRTKKITGSPAMAALFFAGLLLGGANPAPAQGTRLYTVSKMKAEAHAKDAVAAKKRALAVAEQSALNTIFKRIVPFSAFERLPVVKPGTVQGMIENITVRREQNSATQYITSLDYRFNPGAIRDFLTRQGLAYSDVQAQKIALLPVYITAGKIDATGRSPWRRAWLDLDLEHALTPARLVRHGTSLTSENISAILAGDAAAFGELKEKYNTSVLVLAIAEVNSDTARLSTRLYGLDAAGPIALARSDRIYHGRTKETAGRAAAISLRIFEGRWKVLQGVPGDGEGGAGQSAVSLTVEFNGQQQWHEIRKRLAAIPGVQALQVTSLSARSADVTFRYRGGAPKLSSQAPNHNMTVQNHGGAWVLRSN